MGGGIRGRGGDVGGEGGGGGGVKGINVKEGDRVV